MKPGKNVLKCEILASFRTLSRMNLKFTKHYMTFLIHMFSLLDVTSSCMILDSVIEKKS